MAVTLRKATREEIETLWQMQVEAFSALLEKYQDHEINPGAESLIRVTEKFDQPYTTYYFILLGDTAVGAVRVVDKKDGSRKRISPLWIMPEHRGNGYAQQAITALETLCGPDHWQLDTILQEKGNTHLYEKMGYVRTGKIEHVKENMDIVFYEK